MFPTQPLLMGVSVGAAFFFSVMYAWNRAIIIEKFVLLGCPFLGLLDLERGLFFGIFLVCLDC